MSRFYFHWDKSEVKFINISFSANQQRKIGGPFFLVWSKFNQLNGDTYKSWKIISILLYNYIVN